MQKYLATRRGARVVAIVSMTANRTLEHYYQGIVTAVGDDVIMIRDEAMGDVAVSMERIIAVKTLSEPPAMAPPPDSGKAGFEIER